MFICGVALAAANFIMDILVISSYMSSVTTYEENAEAIAIALNTTDTTTSFSPDSEWFTTISAEYEALSNFDKENVYCDVVSIMNDVDEQSGDASTECSVAMVFVVAVAFGLIITGIHRWAVKHNAEVDAEMADLEAQKYQKKRATREEILASADVRFQAKYGAKIAVLRSFHRETFFLFNAAGPFLSMIWLMIVRRTSVTGLDCQDLFFSCGESGDCTMEDLQTTIALNISMVQMLTTYLIFAAGWIICLFCMCFILATGVFHWVARSNIRYLIFSVLLFFYSLVPFVWVYFIAEKFEDSFAGVWGVVVIAAIPMVMTIFYGLWSEFNHWLDTCLD